MDCLKLPFNPLMIPLELTQPHWEGKQDSFRVPVPHILPGVEVHDILGFCLRCSCTNREFCNVSEFNMVRVGDPEGVYIFPQLVQINVPSAYNIMPVADWKPRSGSAPDRTVDHGLRILLVGDLEVMRPLGRWMHGIPNWLLASGVPQPCKQRVFPLHPSEVPPIFCCSSMPSSCSRGCTSLEGPAPQGPSTTAGSRF